MGYSSTHMAYHKCCRRQKEKENFHKHQELQRYYGDDDGDDDFESSIDDLPQSWGYPFYDDESYDDERLNPGRYPFYDSESDDSATNLPLTLPLQLVKLKNQYALLSEPEDENSIEDSKENNQDEGNTAASTSNNAISNEDIGDGSDYEVFQNIYGNKCVKKTGKRRMIKSTAATDKKTRLALYKKKKWINSWCRNGNNDKKTFCVYVDGYYRKNRKAGYGVIIRYHSGFPLVASVGVHDQGKPVSAIYHELQGINRGLELEIKYEIRNFQVRTTSFTAAVLVRTSLYWFDVGCYCDDSESLSIFGTCERCVWNHKIQNVDKNSRLAGVYPLLQEIVGKCALFKRRHWRLFIISVGRQRNKAADYLAKLHERKEEMRPEDFPEQLKDILYEDARMCRQYWKIDV